jgi:hypothetical protein
MTDGSLGRLFHVGNEGGWVKLTAADRGGTTMPEAAMRTCSDCGQRLEDLAQPCPKCGGTDQSVHIDLAEFFTVIDGLASITVVRGPDRSWTEKWIAVHKQLERVETGCTPAGYKGNDDVIRAFEGFFVDCIHVGDWLWNDRKTGFTEAEVRAYIYKDPDLTLCRAVANTGKHHTRSDPNAMTARVGSIEWSPTAIEVSVHWSKGSASGTTDALALARRCVDAWDRLLKSKRLSYQI